MLLTADGLGGNLAPDRVDGGGETPLGRTVGGVSRRPAHGDGRWAGLTGKADG